MLYKLENVKRVHGDRTVLNISELEISPHKIYTLIGPNGAGKTSLLKILSFLDKPSSGKMFFADEAVNFSEKHLYDFRRQVVLLDQNPIMFTGSVRSNIEFGLKVRKMPPAARNERVEEMLALVGMEIFADYDAQSLSGGETKRVALARALALQPHVLLCDEPTANVDNENQEIILQIISKINKVHNSSVIFSTHYLSQGQKLADHTLLLQNGVLSDLTNENIFRGTVIHHSDETFSCQLTGQLALNLPSAGLPAEAQILRLHIDPDGVVFRQQDTDVGKGNSVAGHIVELSQDKGWVRVSVDVGVTMVLRMSMKEYHKQLPALGKKADLFIPHSSVAWSQADKPM